MASIATTLPLNSTIYQMVPPQSINGTAATSAEIDTAGADFLEVTFHAGAIGAADFDEVDLEASNTAGGSYADVTDAQFTVTQTDDNKVWRWYVDLRATGRRYFKIKLDPGAVACLVCADARLWRLSQGPTSSTERGNTGGEKFLPTVS